MFVSDLDTVSIEEIPDGYSNRYGEPVNTNAQRTITKGMELKGDDIADGAKAFTLSLNVDNNTISEAAFERAKEHFSRLSVEQQNTTSISTLAIEFFNQMIQSAQTPTRKRRVKKAEATKPVRRKKKKSSTAKAESSAKMGIQRRIKPKSTKLADFSSLNIPGLAAVPSEPEFQVLCQWESTGVPCESMFDVHWVWLEEDEHSHISQAWLMIDNRGNAEFDVPVTNDATATMAVTIASESDSIEFEALKGLLVVNFGVFTGILILGL